LDPTPGREPGTKRVSVRQPDGSTRVMEVNLTEVIAQCHELEAARARGQDVGPAVRDLTAQLAEVGYQPGQHGHNCGWPHALHVLAARLPDHTDQLAVYDEYLLNTVSSSRMARCWRRRSP
jgi:hypothetical protein